MKSSLTIKCESLDELKALVGSMQGNSNPHYKCCNRLALIRDIRNLITQTDGQPSLIDIKNVVFQHVR